MKPLFTMILAMLAATALLAQPDLTYYLPTQVQYNPAIPTPKSVIGHEVGEWHVTHDKLVYYMKALDAASDRITLEETGHTYEGRPILLLTITSPKNHQNIESIRQQHLQLTDAARSAALNTKDMPAIFYLGCSIHGNEASGANAGLLMAYHLAAAQGPEIEKYLESTVILFDPSFNPDGLQRFSSWVNSRKSKNISADPNDTEHNEAWPGGRFNHYWFDLNRDWLVAQHPESQARVKKFQEWRPNVLTDHHEQGTNATFFFMPGVPSRVNPITPDKNQELTKKMGEYHAKALDQIGSLYFTQEGYDDFYYGKGSTYPDAQGSIGILFEQASSRGHAQESVNGILRFPFTIRNQFVTMLSSLKAINEMREELLNFQREFYKNAAADAAKDPIKAYILGSKDKARLHHFAEMALRQKVDVYKVPATQTINGKTFDAESSLLIPMNQNQYKLIRGMFDKQLKFKDSIFYDISSWVLPLAYGLEYEEVKTPPALGEKITDLKKPVGKIIGKGDYAYAFEPYGYYTHRAMYRLLNNGVRIKIATEIFYAEGKKFERGSVLIPVDGQDRIPAQIAVMMKEIAEQDGIDVYALNTGLDYRGVSLGSSSFTVLRKPEIAILVEGGISPTDAGELWHLLDTRYNLPVTLLPISILNTGSIARYNTILVPEGNHSAITDAGKEKLKTWVQNGGVLIGFERALTFFTTAGLGKFDVKKEEDQSAGKKEATKPKPYADMDEIQRAQETSGAIFEADADLTHPLLYGYTSTKIPLFKANNLFIQKAPGAYANPLVYGSNPLTSGYITKSNLDKLKNTSALGTVALGRGRVIGFTENTAFRAFWFGTNKMLLNAIFWGNTISAEASR
ncbi:MAG: zinc carboxypeptidase [Cyclobacteriaceae bacterium]|nr:zinc carboxypeptidase [Cyclobacteriaceae bacterium]